MDEQPEQGDKPQPSGSEEASCDPSPHAEEDQTTLEPARPTPPHRPDTPEPTSSRRITSMGSAFRPPRPLNFRPLRHQESWQPGDDRPWQKVAPIISHFNAAAVASSSRAIEQSRHVEPQPRNVSNGERSSPFYYRSDISESSRVSDVNRISVVTPTSRTAERPPPTSRVPRPIPPGEGSLQPRSNPRDSTGKRRVPIGSSKIFEDLERSAPPSHFCSVSPSSYQNNTSNQTFLTGTTLIRDNSALYRPSLNHPSRTTLANNADDPDKIGVIPRSSPKEAEPPKSRIVDQSPIVKENQLQYHMIYDFSKCMYIRPHRRPLVKFTHLEHVIETRTRPWVNGSSAVAVPTHELRRHEKVGWSMRNMHSYRHWASRKILKPNQQSAAQRPLSLENFEHIRRCYVDDIEKAAFLRFGKRLVAASLRDLKQCKNRPPHPTVFCNWDPERAEPGEEKNQRVESTEEEKKQARKKLTRKRSSKPKPESESNEEKPPPFRWKIFLCPCYPASSSTIPKPRMPTRPPPPPPAATNPGNDPDADVSELSLPSPVRTPEWHPGQPGLITHGNPDDVSSLGEIPSPHLSTSTEDSQFFSYSDGNRYSPPLQQAQIFSFYKQPAIANLSLVYVSGSDGASSDRVVHGGPLSRGTTQFSKPPIKKMGYSMAFNTPLEPLTEVDSRCQSIVSQAPTDPMSGSAAAASPTATAGILSHLGTAENTASVVASPRTTAVQRTQQIHRHFIPALPPLPALPQEYTTETHTADMRSNRIEQSAVGSASVRAEEILDDLEDVLREQEDRWEEFWETEEGKVIKADQERMAWEEREWVELERQDERPYEQSDKQASDEQESREPGAQDSQDAQSEEQQQEQAQQDSIHQSSPAEDQTQPQLSTSPQQEASAKDKGKGKRKRKHEATQESKDTTEAKTETDTTEKEEKEVEKDETKENKKDTGAIQDPTSPLQQPSVGESAVE